MMIEVTCSCGKVLHAPEQYAGKKGRCKACGAVVQIPDRGPGDVVLTPAQPQPAIADRLDALERENTALRRRCRQLQWGGIAGLIVATGLALAGLLRSGPQHPTPSTPRYAGSPVFMSSTLIKAKRVEADIVSARTVYVPDDQGRSGVMISSRNDPSINLVDASGNPQCMIGVGQSGNPAIFMADAKGVERMRLGLTRMGDNPEIALSDASGTRRCSLMLNPNGDPYIALSNSKGSNRLIMAEMAGGPVGLILYDSKGESRVLAVIRPDDPPRLVVLDSEGNASTGGRK